MQFILDFEQPVGAVLKRIKKLRKREKKEGVDLTAEIEELRREADALKAEIHQSLTPWQRTKMSRCLGRPFALDYIAGLFTEWTELRGDRVGQDDPSIVAGLARFNGRAVAVLGHQKGRSVPENMRRNFGMAKPEGYRKAMRIMHLADRFGLPIFTIVDTPGAYPGVDAEARGQSEAIGRNLMEMSALNVPVVTLISGEGGSGGALGIAVANRVLMLENATYSVITPEGCAAILWRDNALAERAAGRLKITAADCLDNGIIDEVIPEPTGGAHWDRDETVRRVGEAFERHLAELEGLGSDAIQDHRYRRFRALGAFQDVV